MSFGEILYTIFIGPLVLFMEVFFTLVNNVIDNPGLSIIALSLAINSLLMSLYRRVDSIYKEEKLHGGVTHIKKGFKDHERMAIQTCYKQICYMITSVLKNFFFLFLEMPFFIATYRFLSNFDRLEGCLFGVISDLGAQDALISIGGKSINLLPILMFAVNVISCFVFTKEYSLKTKVQIYAMAIFFFFILYKSPAGLVFCWTLHNIFSLVKTILYRLKISGKVLKIMFACIGAVMFIYAFGFNHTELYWLSELGILFMLPLFITLLIKCCSENLKSIKKLCFMHNDSNGRVFYAGTVYMAVLVGAVIPSSLVFCSPLEFIDISYYLNPLWYVWSTLCYAIGTFIVWFGVFYSLASQRTKRNFELGIWLLSGIATIDYVFFGKNMGILSNTLKYEVFSIYTIEEQLKNIGILLLVLIILLIEYRFARKYVPQVLVVASLAFLMVSGYNIFCIQKSVSNQSEVVALSKEKMPTFSLNKKGKNVVVLMLDRAMGQYVPYFLNEKPELAEKFSGFTYYSNVISFGGFTNFATPALFGGYEYTPVEMNKRDTESLMEKHNEALKVMPVLFEKNGYDVTVFDPPYANYQWIPDLSIYDEYPDINTCLTEGKFTDRKSNEKVIYSRKRNFFCYSIMKIVPECIQPIVYDNGNYCYSISIDNQFLENKYISSGTDVNFMGCYTTLENLSVMTKVNDAEKNTFLMMTNDLTHEPMLLQVPEYVPSEHVDNTEYEYQNTDRYSIDGKSLSMEFDYQHKYYQTNMAAFLLIAEWLEFLKKNDVYDNTRIIIVADHGRNLRQLEELILDDGSNGLLDVEYYYPLLIVKDFGSTEFTISDEFMTNADVITLAVDGIIDNPTNPFTGKVISNSEKTAHDQYILCSGAWDVNTNNGNVFLPGMWLSIHDNIFEKSNWTILNENATSPFE